MNFHIILYEGGGIRVDLCRIGEGCVVAILAKQVTETILYHLAEILNLVLLRDDPGSEYIFYLRLFFFIILIRVSFNTCILIRVSMGTAICADRITGSVNLSKQKIIDFFILIRGLFHQLSADLKQS